MSKKKSEQLSFVMEMSIYGYCLSAGLSIAASQIFVCINILAYIIFFLANDSNHSSEITEVRRAGILFVTAALICSTLGVDFSHSWKEVIKTLFYFFFPFSVMKSLQNDFNNKTHRALVILLVSQSLAALHTILSISFPDLYLPKIPGAVTESGQLVLLIPIAFALFYSTSNQSVKKSIPIILALLLTTLTINLKRGPWMGVFFEFIILGIFVSRKLIFYSFFATAISMLFEPVRDRIAALSEHFLIDGGRYSMWTLGLDIFTRFPLGLGLNNSDYMRVFDPSLPQTHRHMHNNLLNIAVEMGVLGLAAYLYLFYTIYLLAKNIYQKSKKENQLLALCLAVGLFGWQIAGTVEYNFGDSEIKLIALLFVGLLFIQANAINDSQ